MCIENYLKNIDLFQTMAKMLLKRQMQLDVDVSPPAISLLVDMNPKC